MHIPMSNSRIWIDVKYKKLYIMKVEIADSLRELFSHKETYRSGHNGAHSKDFYLFDVASPKALKILALLKPILLKTLFSKKLF